MWQISRPLSTDVPRLVTGALLMPMPSRAVVQYLQPFTKSAKRQPRQKHTNRSFYARGHIPQIVSLQMLHETFG